MVFIHEELNPAPQAPTVTFPGNYQSCSRGQAAKTPLSQKFLDHAGIMQSFVSLRALGNNNGELWVGVEGAESIICCRACNRRDLALLKGILIVGRGPRLKI